MAHSMSKRYLQPLACCVQFIENLCEKKTRYSQYLFMLFLLEFSNLFPSLSFLASFSVRLTWCREECEKGERATPRMFVLFNLLKLIYVSVFRFLFEEPGLISGTA